MGDGFSRIGTRGTRSAARAGGAGAEAISATGDGATGGAAGFGAIAGATSGFGESTLPILTGRTEKYTIPEASTAPVAKADANFQFTFTPRPPRLLV
jgi:hypothetical protein